MKKLRVPVAPLLARLQFEAAALAAVGAAQTAVEAIEQLEAAGLALEAARLAAYALPRREAVWWACVCADSVPPDPSSAADAAARAAAEAWVRKPDDEALRYAAYDAAQRTAMKTPEAWAAMGAFWSGPSMSPPGQPVVPPAEHLAGVAVSGAIVLAAVRHRPERAPERFGRFLTSARDIASGGAGWLATEEN